MASLLWLHAEELLHLLQCNKSSLCLQAEVLLPHTVQENFDVTAG